jgi:hypothetical protein
MSCSVGGTALWLVEGERPDSTISSWGDALACHTDDGRLRRPCSRNSDGSSDCRRCNGGGSGSHWCRGGIVALVVALRAAHAEELALVQQRKPWSCASTCASLGSRHSRLVWMRACKRGRRSHSMKLFAADVTISRCWTASSSMTWWEPTIGASGEHLATRSLTFVA